MIQTTTVNFKIYLFIEDDLQSATLRIGQHLSTNNVYLEKIKEVLTTKRLWLEGPIKEILKNSKLMYPEFVLLRSLPSEYTHVILERKRMKMI